MSILNDPRPNPAQPLIRSGLHLRWAFGRKRVFPQHGYHLFRRVYPDPNRRCLSTPMAGMPPGPVQGDRLETPYGRVSGRDLQLTNNFHPRGSPEISLATGGMRLDLPAGTAARRAAVRIAFLPQTTETRTLIDFRPRAASEGANPWIEQDVHFEVFTAAGTPAPKTRIRTNTAEGGGIECNQRLVVTLPQPAFRLALSIRRRRADPPLVLRAWNHDGTLAFQGPPTVSDWIRATLEGSPQQSRSMTRLEIDAPGELTLLHFLDVQSWTRPAAVRVRALRGTTEVATATVQGVVGEIVFAELQAEGITAVEVGGGLAALVDLCYWVGGSDALSQPGPWTAVPESPYPLTLPITHPNYPASQGEEALSVRRAQAAQRIRYGSVADALPAQPLQPGTGTLTLFPGSALVAGQGTSWDESLVGKMIFPRPPSTALEPVDRAYAVMTVLAPDRLVLSRAYYGWWLDKIPYDVADEDVFAQIHDQAAALLDQPDAMRTATMPPVLESSTASRRVVLQDGSRVVKRQGALGDWNMAGLLLETGPHRDVYRIVQFDPAVQEITLHIPYAGPSGPADYRILSRSPHNRIEEGPALSFRPLDLLEIAALSPAYAQLLSLYWIDATAEWGTTYDYMLLADHGGRFQRSGETALAWLNGTPDFTGDAVDGALLSITHGGSPALAAPTSLQAFALPAGRLHSRPDRPDLADSETALSIRDLGTWKARPPAQQPLMLEVWRCDHGPNMPPPGSPPAPQAYASLNDRFLPAQRTTPADAPRPPGWPDPAEVHYLDTGNEGLDIGWYSYRVVAIDAYGRYSALSPPIPWHPVAGGAPLHPYAVHLEDRTPPPPPARVEAWVLEPASVDDPMRVADAAYTAWRARVGAGAVGLRVRWRWAGSHELLTPDLAEFRVYAQSKPLNARFHRIVSVAPAPGDATRSLVKLAAADNLANDAYAGATLQVDERGYAIEKSRGGVNLELRVKNGGPTGGAAPPAGKDATIVLPFGQALHRDVIDPRHWELWFGAVAQKAPANATVRFDIDVMEDPDVVLYDEPANPLHGEAAVWDQTRIRLTDLLPGVLLTGVRPGIDVIALASDAAFMILDIASVGQKQIVPAPPLPLSLVPGTYRWAIGPPDRGLRGAGARWNAATRTLDLLPPKIGRVRPGIDRVHLRVNASSTLADVQHFFEIESVDAAQQKLVLAGAVSLLTNGKTYAWRIGTPVRIYEAFFPSQKAGDPDDPQIGQWLQPTLGEPVVYGTVGVSAADKRAEVADWRPGRTPPRPGNEGLLAGPATVFRVHHERPLAPADGVWDAERLLASRADYHGKSYFTVRWPKPDATEAPHYKALIFRASAETLFQVDAEQARTRTYPLTFDPSDPSDDPRPTHWTPARRADVAAKLFNAKVADYSKLSDDALSVLANLPGNEEAFAQITIDPLDLRPGAHEDIRGPEDTAGYATRASINAWQDEIPGRTQARYLYKIAFVDSAQNRGRLSKASPPVYVPKVVPPRVPVITKIVGGDRQITIHWTANREPDLAGYRVYRTEDKEKAGDVRLMELVKTVGAGEKEYKDAVPGLVTFYYRLAVFDTSGNLAVMNEAREARAFDETPPVAITPQSQWIASAQLLIEWSSGDETLLQRSMDGSLVWSDLTAWLHAGSNSVIDDVTDAEASVQYRVIAKKATGAVSIGTPIILTVLS